MRLRRRKLRLGTCGGEKGKNRCTYAKPLRWDTQPKLISYRLKYKSDLQVLAGGGQYMP